MFDQFSLELQLALALSHPSGIQIEQVNSLCKQNINWQQFIALCHRQHISGLINARLRNYPQLCLPQQVILAFTGYSGKIAARNLFMLGAFEQITKAFAQAQIQMVAFKGIDYIERIYTSIDQRFLSDIDILIQEKDITPARTLLESLGYNCIENIRQSRFHEKRYGYIHAPLQCQKDGVAIDLHIRLGKEKMELNEAVWEHIELKQQHYVMNPAFALIYHCYHLNIHVYGYGFKLSQLHELASLMQLIIETEQQNAWKLATDINGSAWLVNCTALLHYFYQIEITLPFDLKQKQAKIENNILNWIEKEQAAKNLKNLVSLTIFEWLALGFFQVFPTKNYLNQWHANGQKSNSYLKLWFIRALKLASRRYTRLTIRA